MSAPALARLPLFARIDARGVRRGLAAGAAWGLFVGADLIFIEARRCGAICLDDAAFTLVLSIALGITSIARRILPPSPPDSILTPIQPPKPENKTMLLRRLPALAFASALAAAAGALPNAAHAQTAEQQAACQYDAQTYCSAYIPNHELIRRCLVRNRGRISAACRHVLYGGSKRRLRRH